MTRLKPFIPILLLFYGLLTIQVRCFDEYSIDYNRGLTPVYADSVKIHQVLVEPPRLLKNAGKIYYKDSTIYIIERDSGIHVIDNRRPETPRPIRFIKLQGCADIAIKAHTLYADNFTDLAVIDVSIPQQPRMLTRLRGVYPVGKDGKPNTKYVGQYYQCIDETKGKVIAWQYGDIDTVKCYKRL